MHRKFELFMVLCLFAASFLLARKGAALVAASEGSVVPPSDSVTIVLDAGHGGNDPGKIGADGSLEKDINLSIALQLQTLLEKHAYQVVMTRTTDITLGNSDAGSVKLSDLENRIEIMNNANPDFIISIHQNSYTDSSVSGPQVFYYTSSEEGKILASHLQESLNNSLDPALPRNIKGNTDYYILKHASAPAVIIECGFLSNPDEAALLNTSAYQNKLVQAICNGIESYVNSVVSTEKATDESYSTKKTTDET